MTNRWLPDYARRARATDRFRESPDHVRLLAAGLFGEAGSILAEVKKRRREEDVYPEHLGALDEELGDCLWYFVRLCDEIDGPLLRAFARERVARSRPQALRAALQLGSAVGRIVAAIQTASSPTQALTDAWHALQRVARASGMSLRAASDFNLAKTQGRWPLERSRADWPRPSNYFALFDSDEMLVEQFPRELDIEFIERSKDHVILRINGINVGSRLTDNITDNDHYRYHDIFHLSYAVFLGWSPVIRALLRCKRKRSRQLDENEDGARAGIIEEAISAIVFARAKKKHYFRDATQLDYDLLKSIAEFVRGYEVDVIPPWQWERAILEGFRIFRLLKANHGGHVTINLNKRTMHYRKPTARAGR
ncbi:MAG TPA: nucleoside triphosphate pyrophosphohydrolase family protein [Candidatus Cybelea sp.]